MATLDARLRALEDADGARLVFVLAGPRSDISREVESALVDGMHYVRGCDESEAEFRQRVGAAVLKASPGAKLVWLDEQDTRL